MKISVLGTGNVGRFLAAKIAHAGHAPFIGHAAAVAEVLTEFTDANP